jgi:hypothetical protein
MVRRAAVLSLVVCTWAASPAPAQVKLEYKFTEGAATTSKVDIKIHQVLTINGMDVETDSEQSAVSGTSIGMRSADGALPITNTIDSLRVHLSIPGAVIDYDTADPNAKVENAQFAFLPDVMKALAGSSYTIVLDPKNQVKAVEGTEKIAERAKDLDPMAADALKGRLSVDRIKRDFEEEHGNLPTVLAREGEPWERTEVDDIGGGQTLTFRRRYEYQGTTEKDGRTLDKIAVKALEVTYKMDENAQSAAKVTKSDLKIDSSDGSMLFDREAGRVVERKEVTRIKGDMTLKVGEMELPSKLDLTFDTAVTREKAKDAK